ncbi:hypothetical protein N7486_004224 [Penicillium sp. IBT 16267x]|nr:hypothetical protein N7486_004224 [Penicillium sp. IBT 16267x]
MVDSPQTQTFSSADRIRQLNDIDQVHSSFPELANSYTNQAVGIKDVAKLIHSAGLGIQALTNAKPDSSSPAHTGSLESHKTQFKEAAAQYFALLSSIDVRLRRQVYALEEASVLGPETNSRTGDATGTGAGGSGTSAGSGAASNPLDISWLNSRKDTVGKDKEAELWASARRFVEQLDASFGSQPSGKQSGNAEQMHVD